MLQSIYWILAILVMTVLLINGIYMFANNIKKDREYKKFLKKLINEREEK